MGSNDAETFERPFIRRFWAHVDKHSSDTGCWLWLGRVTVSGYGYCYDGKQTAMAHRIAWRIANPHKTLGSALVRHTCDNPPCVNPAHLITGTPRQNNYDMTVRGRNPSAAANFHPVTMSPVADEQAMDYTDELAKLNALIAEELPEPLMETRQGKAARERAFRERDALVCALSKVWPAHLMRPLAQDMSFSPDYQWLVCIHSPAGMIAWRISDEGLPSFAHLEAKRGDVHLDGGHVYKEKYERLAKMPRLWDPPQAAKPLKKKGLKA